MNTVSIHTVNHGIYFISYIVEKRCFTVFIFHFAIRKYLLLEYVAAFIRTSFWSRKYGFAVIKVFYVIFLSHLMF